MSDLLATSSYISPNPEDQISQLTQRTLNFIEQIIHYAVTKALNIAVTKAFNKKLGLDCRRPAFVNKDPPSNV